MDASMAISAEEFAARRERLRDYAQQQAASGIVLWDNSYIHYFSGFAFIPTERPIAFLMNVRGESALFVPRLESEHAQMQTGFERVDHYLEYPYTPHPMEVLAKTMRDMGISGSFGSDGDGYPWIFGYRGPALS